MSTPFCVVDANIGIKLFLNYEEDSELVAALFADQLNNPLDNLIAVPGFFYIECAFNLRKAVRAGQYDAAQSRRDLTDLELMDLFTVQTASVSGKAFEISSIYGASVYDACYVIEWDWIGLTGAALDESYPLCFYPPAGSFPVPHSIAFRKAGYMSLSHL